MKSKKSPLEVLKEANRRKKSYSIETPLDFIRILNRERKIKESTERIIRRLKKK